MIKLNAYIPPQLKCKNNTERFITFALTFYMWTPALGYSNSSSTLKCSWANNTIRFTHIFIENTTKYDLKYLFFLDIDCRYDIVILYPRF